MGTFLQYMDEVYSERKEKVKSKFNDFKIDEKFTIYEELFPIKDGINSNVTFQLKKMKRTSLLLVKDVNGRKVKLYFTEFDIIYTLIYIYDNYIFQGNYICNQMCKLINDSSNNVEFKIKDKKFSFKGIQYLNKDKDLIFITASDYEISVNDFICLLNIVFQKDRSSQKSNDGKGTILKYLLFMFLFSKRTSDECKENLKRILKDIKVYKGEDLNAYRWKLNKIGKEKFYIDMSVSKDIVCYNNIEES